MLYHIILYYIMVAQTSKWSTSAPTGPSHLPSAAPGPRVHQGGLQQKRFKRQGSMDTNLGYVEGCLLVVLDHRLCILLAI